MKKIKPENEGPARPAVRSTDWLEALEEKLARRVEYLNAWSRDTSDLYIHGKAAAMTEALYEFRACARKRL